MREYLDRVVDAHWEEHPQEIPNNHPDIKKFVGESYILLRGLCLQNDIWFEEAVGEAYNALQQTKK